MASKTDYLMNLYDLADQEFFILKNSVDYKEVTEIGELEKLWKAKKIDELAEKINKLFLKNRINFIIPEDKEEKNSFREIAFLRLHTLFVITSDVIEAINDSYDDELLQRLQMRYPNSKVDFTEISTLTRVAREYLDGFYTFINGMETPIHLKSQVEKIKKYLGEVVETKDIEHFYKSLYIFFDYINSFLDSMEGAEFDWSTEEVVKANQFFSWILFIESIVYYLVLLKEKYLKIQEDKTNIQLQERTDVLDQREDAINEINIIETLDKYSNNSN